MGKALSANIVAFGALVAQPGAVSLGRLEMAVPARVPATAEAFNRKALETGIGAAGNLLKKNDGKEDFYENSTDE